MKISIAHTLSTIVALSYISLLLSCNPHFKSSTINLSNINQRDEALKNDVRKFNYFLHVDDSMYQLKKMQTFSGVESINHVEGTLQDPVLKDWILVYKYMDSYPRGKGPLLKDYKPFVNQAHIFVTGVEMTGDSIFQVLPEQITNYKKFKKTLSSGAKAGIGVGAVAATIGIAALAACNCPHVYVNNGHEYYYNNTLFTGAIGAQLERYDDKLMPDIFPKSDSYTIKIVNELDESHYVNKLELLNILHEKGLSAIPDNSGKIHTIKNPIGPVNVTDSDGVNQMEKVSQKDESFYTFNNDKEDGLKELVLEFDAKRQTTDAKLVLTLRNSKWSGYAYDKFNQLFGKNYPKWVEMNEKKTKEEQEQWLAEQGIKLLVDIKTKDGWVNIDHIDLVGDVATNSKVVLIKKELFTNTLTVRLRAAFMFWELDYAGVDYSVNKEVVVQTVVPFQIIASDNLDHLGELMEDDDQYLELLKSPSSVEVIFEGLRLNPDYERTILLRSKGYYVSNKQYVGRTKLKKIKKFTDPGEFSIFSQELFVDLKE